MQLSECNLCMRLCLILPCDHVFLLIFCYSCKNGLLAISSAVLNLAWTYKTRENWHPVAKKIKRTHHYHRAWETCYMRPVLHLREQFNWILIELNSSFVKIELALCKCTSEIHTGKRTGTIIQELLCIYMVIFSLNWSQFCALFFSGMEGE